MSNVHRSWAWRAAPSKVRLKVLLVQAEDGLVLVGELFARGLERSSDHGRAAEDDADVLPAG